MLFSNCMVSQQLIFFILLVYFHIVCIHLKFLGLVFLSLFGYIFPLGKKIKSSFSSLDYLQSLPSPPPPSLTMFLCFPPKYAAKVALLEETRMFLTKCFIESPLPLTPNLPLFIIDVANLSTMFGIYFPCTYFLLDLVFDLTIICTLCGYIIQ